MLPRKGEDHTSLILRRSNTNRALGIVVDRPLPTGVTRLIRSESYAASTVEGRVAKRRLIVYVRAEDCLRVDRLVPLDQGVAGGRMVAVEIEAEDWPRFRDVRLDENVFRQPVEWAAKLLLIDGIDRHVPHQRHP